MTKQVWLLRVVAACVWRAVPASAVKFLAVAAANTVLGVTTILVVKVLVGWGDAAANALGYGAGLASGFTLNRQWTFSFRQRGPSSLFRFLVVFVAAYTVNLVIVLSLIHWGNVPPLWSHVAGAVPYSVLFYSGCRWYAFPLVVTRLSASRI